MGKYLSLLPGLPLSSPAPSSRTPTPSSPENATAPWKRTGGTSVISLNRFSRNCTEERSFPVNRRQHFFKFYVLKVKCSAHLGPRMEVSHPHKSGGIVKKQLSWFSWATGDAVTFLRTQKDYLLPLVSRESFSLTVDEVTSAIVSNAVMGHKIIKKGLVGIVQASLKKPTSNYSSWRNGI